jgi:hypothetical protein
MPNSDEKVRLHVHRGIKVAAIVGVLLGSFDLYLSWQFGPAYMGLMGLLVVLSSMYVFFLADSKIDVDQNEVRIIAPHGEYVLPWNEVTAVEKNKFTTILFAQNKALAYNLLLAGRGKRKFDEYINQIIRDRQFTRSRPAGITNSMVQKLMRNTKVRGWKII